MCFIARLILGSFGIFKQNSRRCSEIWSQQAAASSHFPAACASSGARDTMELRVNK